LRFIISNLVFWEVGKFVCCGPLDNNIHIPKCWKKEWASHLLWEPQDDCNNMLKWEKKAIKGRAQASTNLQGQNVKHPIRVFLGVLVGCFVALFVCLFVGWLVGEGAKDHLVLLKNTLLALPTKERTLCLNSL
jgi:hypothetical protein